MVTDVEYMQIVNEIYDLSDYNTKKKVLFCNEAKKVVNVEHIVGNLYDHIKNNCDAIDFGSIPRSRGVVTRIENYKELVDCIGTIRDLVVAYNEDPKIVNTLSTVLDNVHQRERIFTKAYALNIEFPMMMYNTAVLSVVSGTSLLIGSCIEYIKNGHDSFITSFNKAAYIKSREGVLFQYAEQFNSLCANGTLDKLMDACVKNNLTPSNESAEVMNEGIVDTAKNIGSKMNTFGKVVTGVISVIGLVITLFKILRISIYYWKRMQMSVSDWFAIQANYLQINAENLKYREDDRGDDHRKAVYQRQMKWVNTFNKISNALALKDSKAKKDAQKDEDDYSRKKQYEDEDENDGGLF